VYAGTRAGEVARILDLIHREIQKMAGRGMTSEELKRTKEQMKGGLMLSLESSHSRMNKLAKDELIAGTHTSLEEMISDIDAVTEQQVSRVARSLFTTENMAMTGLGPLSSRQIERLSQRFPLSLTSSRGSARA
jgi:predicted Zn-dependent peptidase